jgi:hypothetical protein
MATMQNVCDKIRLRIGDAQKARVTDNTILGYLNDLTKVVYQLRPDFFTGSFGSSPPADAAIGATFPLPIQMLPAAVEYGTAMCNLPDDEETRQQKAQDAEKRFMLHVYGPR